MTKPEAIDLMQQGIKMTHEYFSPTEWVTIKNGNYLLEDGVECSYQEFWKWRQETYWQTGWEKFKGE